MFPSAIDIVMQFLRANGFTETLSTLVKEAGLSTDESHPQLGQITLEQLLDEKRAFDTSVSFERLGLTDVAKGWRWPAPTKGIVYGGLASKTNILKIASCVVRLPTIIRPRQCIAVTTADRALYLLDAQTADMPVLRTYVDGLDSPILDLVMLDKGHLLLGFMSGKLSILDVQSGIIIDERKVHRKYVVRLAARRFQNSFLVASAGWDSQISLQRIDVSTDEPAFTTANATITMASIPETIFFTERPEIEEIVLVATRRDSTCLHYYAVASADQVAVGFLGTQNLGPHSPVWSAFTPADVQPCPTDPSLVAVATSSVPHMRLQLVRLLIPRNDSSEPIFSQRLDFRTLPAQGRPSLHTSQQQREEAAIILSINTMAPQTAYSTPGVVWRTDGSGLFVTADDGMVRGFDSTTGMQIVAMAAHTLGTKIRCLWTGITERIFEEASGTQEVLLTGGFDQKLIVWSMP